MPALLTFGDSNTYGMLPVEVEGQLQRLCVNTRWPGLVRQELGPGWVLIEEGLPGRTTCHSDIKAGPHKDGRLGLSIALESHGPIDVMTLMLGTNDLKSQFDLSPDSIAAGVGTLLDIALSDEMQDRHNQFGVLLICPPPILERGVIAGDFIGGSAKSHKLAALYRDIADRRNIGFLDAGSVIESSGIDGIHFDQNSHALLAGPVASSLKDLVTAGS